MKAWLLCALFFIISGILLGKEAPHHDSQEAKEGKEEPDSNISFRDMLLPVNSLQVIGLSLMLS